MAAQNKSKSFKKTAKETVNLIPGTKSLPHNFTLVTSTGLSALDTILGGGLPLGSLLFIEEDEYSFYAELLAKYFLAEGIVNNQRIVTADRRGRDEKLLSNLPAPANAEAAKDSNPSATDNEEMRIAWRYQNLGAADTTIGGKTSFGHNFDLTRKLSEEVLNAADVTRWKDSDGYLCDNLAETLRDSRHSTVNSSDNLQVCRIALLRLGPPFWDVQEVAKILYCLRSCLRKSAAVAMVTVPSHLLSGKSHIAKWSHLADMCIRLESFAGTARAKNPALKDYHGLLHITKLAAFNSLSPHAILTDLAFKLRRRRLIIERLCLPPELEDTDARGEENGAVLMCGSTNSKKLDF